MTPRYQQQAHSRAALSTVASEAQEIAQASADFRRARGFRRKSLETSILTRMDRLLETLLSHFRGRVSPEETERLIEHHHPLTHHGLARLPEAAVPLIVMRELISIHQSPIDRDRLSNWPLFAERYHGSYC